MKKRQIILLFMPWILLATTYFAFISFEKIMGDKLGYLLAFVFYWIFWCFLFPLMFTGRKRIKEMFSKVGLQAGKLKILAVILLLLPPVLALSTVFAVKIPTATVLIVLGSFAIALINGTAEELLWRGVYVREFSGKLFMGYLYPAFGFAIWHLAPQAVHPISMPGGVLAFIFGAFFVGACWGWVAWKTNSIRLSIFSHVLTDFLGLGATIYFL